MIGGRSQKLTFLAPRKFFCSTTTLRAVSQVLRRFCPRCELSESKQGGSRIAEHVKDGMWKLELKLHLRRRKRLQRKRS